MRELISLVEDAQGIDRFTGQSVIGVLAHHTPPDIETSWIMKAYDAAGGGTARLDQSFADYLDTRVREIKQDLSEWLLNPTPLMRGLRDAPKENHPLGVHWTDKKITAQDYGNGKYLLQARVRPEQIDWLYTIVARIAWDKENEFRLKPGSELSGTVEGGNSGRPIGEFHGKV